MKTIILLLAGMVMISVGASAQVSGSVSAELSLDQEQFIPDEDVIVSLQIKNRSGQTIELGKEADWVTFTVQGESDLVVPKIADMPVQGEFSLKSSQAGTKTFNLTPYFGFRQPGHYRVVATVKLAQWKGVEIYSKPINFAIMNGVPLPTLPDIAFGVPLPAGVTNAAPEVRKYCLQKVTYQNEPRLYFRLTDQTGSRTFTVYPIGRMVSFGLPEAQVDSSSNLHVLHQYYAKSFNYCVISPDGKLLVRQTHDYTATRPTLKSDSEGRIYVAGGARRYTLNDYPKPTAPTFESTTNAPNQ